MFMFYPILIMKYILNIFMPTSIVLPVLLSIQNTLFGPIILIVINLIITPAMLGMFEKVQYICNT